MSQTPNPSNLQLNLGLDVEPCHELGEEIRVALMEALAELLLEAHGQESVRNLTTQGESKECKSNL